MWPNGNGREYLIAGDGNQISAVEAWLRADEKGPQAQDHHEERQLGNGVRHIASLRIPYRLK